MYNDDKRAAIKKNNKSIVNIVLTKIIILKKWRPFFYIKIFIFDRLLLWFKITWLARYSERTQKNRQNNCVWYSFKML